MRLLLFICGNYPILYVFSIEPLLDGPERVLRCLPIKQFNGELTISAKGYKHTTRLRGCNCGMTARGGNLMCEGGCHTKGHI